MTRTARRRPSKLAEDFTDIATDIVAKVFDPGDLFSGNVDARALRDTASQVGYKENSRTGKAGPALVAGAGLREHQSHQLVLFDEREQLLDGSAFGQDGVEVFFHAGGELDGFDEVAAAERVFLHEGQEAAVLDRLLEQLVGIALQVADGVGRGAHLQAVQGW